MENKVVLRANNITKRFSTRGQVYPVLKGIDLTVNKGEFVGVMGPSGSGKTTLLNVLSTIDRPTSGNVEISSNNIATMKDREISKFRRKHLGFIFQDYNLLDTLTVKENIVLPLTVGKVDKTTMLERLDVIAQKLNIDTILEKYPYELSGGQKQRTAAARALIMDPAIVFADEPTGALDSKSATQLLGKLTELNDEGATIMMVTHDPVAASFCFIKDGEIYTEIYKGD